MVTTRPRVWATACLVIATSIATTGQERARALPDRPGARRPALPSGPRLAALPDDQWNDVHKAVVAKHAPALRPPPHTPPLADSFLSFPAYLSQDSTLPPRHRELLILRTAWLRYAGK